MREFFQQKKLDYSSKQKIKTKEKIKEEDGCFGGIASEKRILKFFYSWSVACAEAGDVEEESDVLHLTAETWEINTAMVCRITKHLDFFPSILQVAAAAAGS